MMSLLFDLDGTLIDSIPLWIEANIQALKAQGISMNEEMFLTDFYQQGLHHSGILEKCGVDVLHTEAFYETRNALFETLLRTKIEWLGNAGDVIRECASVMPLGLLTGSTRRAVDAMNERLHFSTLFTEILTADDTLSKMKPDPYGLFLLAKKLNVDPVNCLYIGDQPVDILAAKAAGMKSCLIPTDLTPEGTREMADIVLERLDDLLSKVTPENLHREVDFGFPVGKEIG